jgi:hypothetical protein
MNQNQSVCFEITHFSQKIQTLLPGSFNFCAVLVVSMSVSFEVINHQCHTDKHCLFERKT